MQVIDGMQVIKMKVLFFSGDITHSDAAEYIDINMNNTQLSYVVASIHLYSYGYCTYYEYKNNEIPFGFGSIDECFTGLMAVNNLDSDVSLYDPKNCIITHYLFNNSVSIDYGFIDVQNRLLYIIDENKEAEYYENDVKTVKEYMDNLRFNISTYLDMLLEAQHCELVKTEEEADVVLVLDKPSSDKEISLIDQNYFADK